MGSKFFAVMPRIINCMLPPSDGVSKLSVGRLSVAAAIWHMLLPDVGSAWRTWWASKGDEISILISYA